MQPRTAFHRPSIWSPWMWSLTVGCIVGSAWSSSAPAPALAPVLSHPVLQPAGSRHHHSAPVSIYRSPASLRGGHGLGFIRTRERSVGIVQLLLSPVSSSPAL
ncbi:neurexin 3 isoform X15 [Arapaima gigas]